MFMMFHTAAARRPWLIAFSLAFLVIGVVMLLARGPM